MYTDYTRQALPSEHYCELLGIALCVFNSNNSFVIENILGRLAPNTQDDWFKLIDKTSGRLAKTLENAIEKSIVKDSERDGIKDDKNALRKIFDLFSKLVCKRDRIVHSFLITTKNGEQMLQTKELKNNNQFLIDEDYLLRFIKQNDELSSELHNFRGY